MDIASLHHISIPVKDIDRSKAFYSEVLGLREIARPNFPFQGAWYRVADGQELHLILEHTNATYRNGKPIDPGDIHFAIRVQSYRATVAYLQSRGYREELQEDDLRKLRVLPHPLTGYPQLYILDPDRHLIEINAERLD